MLTFKTWKKFKKPRTNYEKNKWQPCSYENTLLYLLECKTINFTQTKNFYA